MKKLMIAASAALCAAVGLADIESNNIVGYNQDTLEAGKFYIKAAQFQDVESGEIDLNKVCSGFVGVPYDDSSAFLKTAAQVMILGSNDKYTYYYYLTDGYISDTEFKEGWCDEWGNYVDLKVTAGTAFWVKSVAETVERTTSGAVAMDEEVSVAVEAARFSLVANAFPMPITLNGDVMKVSGIKPVPYDESGAYLKTAPQLMVLNEKGKYSYYYYLADGYISDTEFKEGWCDEWGNYVNDAVPIGVGFWIKGANKMTVVFSR